jgi:hypothetical protein
MLDLLRGLDSSLLHLLELWLGLWLKKWLILLHFKPSLSCLLLLQLKCVLISVIYLLYNVRMY